MIGEQLGKYTILEEVGQGGMAVVYRARDTVLDRNVAIKVLHPHLSRREESQKRFEREARAVAKLSHNRILQVFDFSETGADASYIVMEFLDGCTLREFIEKHPIVHPEVAAMISVHLCSALSHAHDLGIIHRDIKPENVMIAGDVGVKLMDFGIAEIVDAQTMTTTGTLLGSPAHMSPEMIEGHDLDFRADIFSLGTVLYFAATGELPFSGRNAPLVLKAILEGDYITAEMITPRVGRNLSRIIDRCLARDPDDRYSTTKALQHDLEAYLADCNLTEPDRELAAFFADPEGYQLDLGPKLVDALEQRGLDALKTNHVARALEYFGRVLTIEPDHPRVLDHIHNIDKRRRLKVYGGGVALIAVSTLLIFSISAMVEDPPPLPPTPAPIPQIPDPVATEAGETAAGLVEQRANILIINATVRNARREASLAFMLAFAAAEGEADAAYKAEEEEDKPDRVRMLASNGHTGSADAVVEPVEPPVANSAAEAVLLKVRVFPSGVQLTLNGRSYTASQLSSGIKVDPGVVPWSATCDVCQPLNAQKWVIRAKDGPTITKSVDLNFKPALFRVNCSNDKGARVLVFDATSKKQISQGSVDQWIIIPIRDKLTASQNVAYTVISSRDDTRPIKGGPHFLQAGKSQQFAVEF